MNAMKERRGMYFAVSMDDDHSADNGSSAAERMARKKEARAVDDLGLQRLIARQDLRGSIQRIFELSSAAPTANDSRRQKDRASQLAVQAAYDAFSNGNEDFARNLLRQLGDSRFIRFGTLNAEGVREGFLQQSKQRLFLDLRRVFVTLKDIKKAPISAEQFMDFWKMADEEIETEPSGVESYFDVIQQKQEGAQ